MVHIGTLGLVLEPLVGALRALVKHEAGSALVMVDLNCRPAAVPDREAYRISLERPLARTHVVKARVEDLTWLFPDVPPTAAARGLLEQDRIALEQPPAAHELENPEEQDRGDEHGDYLDTRLHQASPKGGN